MTAEAGADRTPVSVVVPFAGGRTGADQLAANLARLNLRDRDELVVADNSAGGMPAVELPRRARVVRAAAERSAYHARNAGARDATCEWLLFLDADCAPSPGLVDAYFSEPVPARCGAVAGAVRADPGQRALIARYARDRGFLNMAGASEGPGWRIAVAGNVIVRRTAFEAIGGFVEGIRSGGDVDISRRLLAAGWTIDARPRASVEHHHRERLLPFLATIARYAAGSRWLERRYPGRSPRWPLVPQLGIAARDAAALAVRGRREQATFRVLDGLGLVAHNVGYVSGNSARR